MSISLSEVHKVEPHTAPRNNMQQYKSHSSDAVASFKGSTDENKKIAKILQAQFNDLVIDPVFDIGAGMGDIALVAWPERDVTLLDILDYRRFPKSPRHKRVLGDFFCHDWSAGCCFGTILFSHVLQYLDDNPAVLAKRIAECAPQVIISVTDDCRDEPMRQVLDFARTEIGNINAEAAEYDFVPDYELHRSVKLRSRISSSSFERLAEDFYAVVFDRILDADELKLCAEQLREVLPDGPTFTLSQIVRGYTRATT